MKTIIATILSCAALMAQAPTILSVTPNNGTGAQQTFSVTVQDSNGDGMNLIGLHLDINKENGTQKACHVFANPQANQVALFNDAGNSLFPMMTTGTSGAETNSQCTLYANGSNRIVNGSQVTMAFNIAFNQTSFAGVYYLDVVANTYYGVSDGGSYVTRGTWVVPPAAESYSVWSFNTYTNGVYGSPTGTGSSVVYQHQGYDSLGPAAIGSQGIYLSGSTGACLLTFTRATHLVTLYADNWTMLTAVAGTPGATLQNSQCTVDVGNTTYGDYAPWSLSIFTVPIYFTQSFRGNASLYASTNALSGGSTGWVSVGSWTIPAPAADTAGKLSMGVDATHPSTTIDDYTGLTIPLPSSVNPSVSLNLSTPSEDGPDTLHFGDTYVVTIRHAKPSTQVWGREQSADVPTPIYFKPNAQGSVIAPIVADPFAGGWLLGTTDATGYLIIPAKVPTGVDGNNYISLYVGNDTGTQQQTDGGLYTSQLNDTNAIGAVSFFANNSAGVPAPPVYLSAVLRSGRKIQSLRAKPLKMHPPTSTYEKIGDKWEYSFDLDTATTPVKLFRIGHDDGYQGDETDVNNMNFSHQNGWDGGGNGWIYADGFSTRSEHSKFKIVSDWLPGPVSVMFTDALSEPFDVQEDMTDADQQAAARLGSIFKASTRKNVIGPAIAPDDSLRNLLARIRNWVDQGNHFLIPLAKDGADLAAELEKLQVSEGYEQNVVNCIKAAIPVLSHQ